MTLSHDTPVASETEPSQTASSSSVAPRKLIERGEALAQQRADHAAGRVGEAGAGEMQRGQAAAAGERQEKAQAAERGRAAVDGFAAAALLEQAVSRDARA